MIASASGVDEGTGAPSGRLISKVDTAMPSIAGNLEISRARAANFDVHKY